MEKVFSITDPSILQTIAYYLGQIFEQRKINDKDAYYVLKNGEIQLVIYDCKVFKSHNN